MSEKKEILQVVKLVCAGDFAAIGERALDTAELALDDEQLPVPGQKIGREFDHWVLIEHIHAVTRFVKLAWELYASVKGAASKDQKAELEKAARERKILMPGDVEFDRIMSEIDKAKKRR